jgi:hypothetical protein
VPSPPQKVGGEYTPGVSNAQLKEFVRAGLYPKRFTLLEVSKAVRKQLLSAVGAAASFTGSAAGGAVPGAGKLVFGMASAVETYE